MLKEKTGMGNFSYRPSNSEIRGKMISSALSEKNLSTSLFAFSGTKYPLLETSRGRGLFWLTVSVGSVHDHFAARLK